MKIGVVDYQAGNLTSVETALAYLGADYFIINGPEGFVRADKLIFPGVGHAASAMEYLESSGLGQGIKDYAQTGKSILGICLGSQIILDYSEENQGPCLGLVPGKCLTFQAQQGEKVPHMGWNQINFDLDTELFRGLPQEASVYFVHSYYPAPSADVSVLSRTFYIHDFVSAYRWNNIQVTQFHPEKSGPVGLKILQNFLEGAGDA